MTTENDQAAGFSLVEVLVTLCLISLICTMTLGLYRQYSSLSQRRVELARETTAYAVLDYVRGEIEGARKLHLTSTDAEQRAVFIGTPSSVRFVGLTSVGFSTSALRDIEIGGTPGASAVRFSRRVYQRGSLEPILESEETLVQGQSMAFEFQYLSDRGAHPVWSSDWKDTGYLPAGVKILATLSGRTVSSVIAYLAR